MKSPKVSVVVIAYNHEEYIKQAIESFLAQEVDFDLEIIIADDASQDKTPDIIRGYAEQHPEVVKPILRKKNIGAVKNSIGSLQAAKGKYIALCEGDDYWTDPKKLQKQVNFLDRNPDYALCFHPVRVFFEDGSEPDYVYPPDTDKTNFTSTQLLAKNFIQTNSVMYKRRNYSRIPNTILPLDWYLHLYHAQFGKIGFINGTMAAYRRHSGGLWWDSDKNLDQIWLKYGMIHLNLFVEMLKLIKKNPKHEKIIYGHIGGLFTAFAEVDRKQSTNLLNEALDKFPEGIKHVITEHSTRINLQEKEIKGLKSQIDEQSQLIKSLKNALDQKNEDIRLMRASRVWRLRNRIALAIGKKVI